MDHKQQILIIYRTKTRKYVYICMIEQKSYLRLTNSMLILMINNI